MAKPKFTRGTIFVAGKNRNKQTGSDHLEYLEDALAEQAKCDPCGCDSCYCYETICAANTGELLIRYYTVNGPGSITEVIEPFDEGLANVKALYAARNS